MEEQHPPDCSCWGCCKDKVTPEQLQKLTSAVRDFQRLSFLEAPPDFDVLVVQLAADVEIEVAKVTRREGDRGGIHDDYEFRINDCPFLIVRHYVEYSPEEVPLQVQIPLTNPYNLSK